MPNPKAKPCHSSGSMPQLRSTLGWTMPQPPSSSHEPSGRWMSNSADGSVNGKYDGRRREVKSPPKNALVNASMRAGQVGEGDVAVDHQALDLVEHRHVGGVGGVLPEHPARHDHVDTAAACRSSPAPAPARCGCAAAVEPGSP